MTDEEFRRLREQARAEARRALPVRPQVQGRDLYEARARHAEFGAAAH
ncbi:hypothetical protein GTW43_06005 [Streptomyces sp. SID5785]|nr:hypothetical protein [Streptomyces sp. SID5785]MZD04638.1 hypothetical protein [Streptomyces sp. SID5785]